MSKDRKEIYLGDGLRRALRGRKESLTSAVNTIADRYEGILERTTVRLSPLEIKLAKHVIEQARTRLGAAEIAAFPAMVADHVQRTAPESSIASAFVERLGTLSYPDLVAVVEMAERS